MLAQIEKVAGLCARFLVLHSGEMKWLRLSHVSGAFEQEMEIDSSRKRQKKTWHKGVCVYHDVLSLRNVAYCINLPVVIVCYDIDGCMYKASGS